MGSFGMPNGTALSMSKLSEVCPEGQVWTTDKCTLPGPAPSPAPAGGNGSGFPLWAKLLVVLGVFLLLCCLGALFFFCSRRKDREEQIVAVEHDGRGCGVSEQTTLSDEAKQRCKEAFALIDGNGNGKISRAEVIKACRESEKVRNLLGLPKVIRQEDGSRDQFEAVFQRMDKNESKDVSLDEFSSFFCSYASTRASESDSSRAALGNGR